MIENKVALVTGSSSGIGLATAERLAEAGADIVLHGLMSQKEGMDLVSHLENEYNIRCMFSNADLRDPEAIAGLIDQALEGLGSIDILVNNAGIQHTEGAETFPLQKWNDILAINLSAAFLCMQKCLPGMRERQWGRIINIASVHGLVGSVNKSAYCASKHGLVGLTKVIALENAEFGISANCICPGWVDTPILAAQIEQFAQANQLSLEEAKRKIVTTKQPVPEMMAPSQIGDFIVFLCSDAAKTISGAALPIDGAWTAQ
ncbi:3-hydroxybutyrate dehydrogenase [Pseudomaricurvus alkylphenolicus]|uniref:3-hydroxybutyrate dehydrogenase n=1 Tax=Pseudomaricurvus alkylphenolicus TaxID=1306991 RepID=UPI00141F6C77|nr:3-hydroxybutyrate dehydrogenase [Pseudomaricurvus alkylphenolicus]NIB38585.1 3-hydroxybutyrate dehydrogenase [Pseudomaricurvus alkylphenolicus]